MNGVGGEALSWRLTSGLCGLGGLVLFSVATQDHCLATEGTETTERRISAGLSRQLRDELNARTSLIGGVIMYLCPLERSKNGLWWA